jgi:hypothetical protein
MNKNQKKEPIEYQPRAPLVLPPATETAAAELPPPVESAAGRRSRLAGRSRAAQAEATPRE